MAVKPVGMMSQFANSFMLDAGARAGFDSVVNTAGIGAGIGAINGAFSDYEGVFSGALKGGVVGGLTGYGIKHAGTKYATNYSKKLNSFTDADLTPGSENFLRSNTAFDSSLMKGWSDTTKSPFNTETSVGKDHLASIAKQHSDYLDTLPKT